jgi:hypothetical protein
MRSIWSGSIKEEFQVSTELGPNFEKKLNQL